MKKGIKNVIASLISQILIIGLGIVIPRLVLINLGSEANGLLSSFNGILSYLALLESGVGLATQQALYKPIAEDDKKTINEIMSATNYYYQRIGRAYTSILLMIAIVYSLTVSTTIPRSTVLVVVLLSGLSGALNYFFSSKFSLYLVAEGKSYVTTVIATTFSIVTSLAKILLLVWGGGLLQLQILYFILSALQILAICLYMRKYYRWIDCNAEPNYKAISQRHAVLVHKLAGLVFSSTDVLLLTYFCDLKVVSVYNMYAMLFGMMKSVAVSFSDGFLYLLGQNFSNKKVFEKLYDIYEMSNMAITFAVFCIGYMLTIPFLKLYTAGIVDINYINKGVAILFAAYYLLENGRKSSLTVASIAEKFEETKWHSVLEAVINFTVSFICTWKFGIYGVLIGTIAGLLYRTTDAILYAAKLLDKPASTAFCRWIRNLMIFLLVTNVESKISVPLDNYLQIILFGIVLSIVTVIMFVGINFVREPDVFKYVYEKIKTKLYTKMK